MPPVEAIKVRCLERLDMVQDFRQTIPPEPRSGEKSLCGRGPAGAAAVRKIPPRGHTQQIADIYAPEGADHLAEC